MNTIEPYYQSNGVTLHCGDNVEVLRSLDNDCVDLTVTSPPYDNLRTYGGHQWGWDEFIRLAPELFRVTKQGGVVVWIVNDATVDGSETGTSFRQALHFKDCGFNLHDTMTWNKGGFSAVGSTAVRYGPVSEFMFILTKGRIATFNPLKDRRNAIPNRTIHGTVKDSSGVARPVSNIGKQMGTHGIRFNVWNTPPDKESLHPAPFPTQLARDHILSWSNEGDTVLDCFNGSGTTTKMAKLMGRQSIGIEVNAEYCDIAINRLRQGVFDFA